jgi:hypothetical protein
MLMQLAKMLPELLTEKQTHGDVAWGRERSPDQPTEHPFPFIVSKTDLTHRSFC